MEAELSQELEVKQTELDTRYLRLQQESLVKDQRLAHLEAQVARLTEILESLAQKGGTVTSTTTGPAAFRLRMDGKPPKP